MNEESRKPAPYLTFLIILFVVVVAVVGIQIGIDRQTTSASESYPRIEVPMTINFVRSTESQFGSQRDVDDAINMMRDVNEIWNQAGIFFKVEEVNNVEFTQYTSSVEELRQSMLEGGHHNPAVINAYFVGKMDGLNGIAFIPDGMFFLSDFVSVSEARTAAHEIGHLVGLGHIAVDRQRLMNSGSAGKGLSKEEILIARAIAEQIKEF